MSELKFLIDENVGQSIINYLKQQRYDITIVSENLTGREDEYLINKAFNEKRIIITNDKDFGFLIFKRKLSSSGIILFKFKYENTILKINSMEQLIKNN